MDEDEINSLFQVCKGLKYKFCGVFAADGSLLKLSQNRFILWMYTALVLLENTLGGKNGNYVFAVPLEHKVTSYKCFYNRLASASPDIQIVYEMLRNQSIQTQN